MVKKIFSLATLIRAAVVILLAIAFATALAQQTIDNGLLSRGQEPAIEHAKKKKPQKPGVSLRTHVNKKAHYSFGYPPGWQVVSDGSLSRITSPDRKVVISLGVAASGSVETATSKLLSLLRQNYSPFRVKQRRTITVKEASGVRVAGSAENQHGLSLQFVTVTLAQKSRNFTIAAFYDPSTKTPEVGAVVDAIIESFRTIKPA